MKNTIKYLTLTLVVSLTFLVSCSDFLEKIDDFNVGVTNTIFEQSAVIELQDYLGNNDDIINTDFTINFTGPDADKLVNEAGEFIINETDGFIQLNVNPNKSSGVQELNFNLEVSGGSYRAKTFNINLKDTTSYIPLYMVNGAKMKGTSKTSNSATLVNNATTNPVTLETAKADSNTATKVTVSSGTTFKDATGNAITGTDISIDITNVDDLAGSLDPEYQSEKTYIDQNGTTITNMVPVILNRARINMSVGGTSVKEFNKPIDLAIEIPSDSNNPITGNPIQIGDTFPIYTTEENSDNWTFHGNGNVIAGSTSSTFDVVFSTTHLSDYAIMKFEDKECDQITWSVLAPNAVGTGEFVVKLEYNYDYGFDGIKPGEFDGDVYLFDIVRMSVLNGQITNLSVDTGVLNNLAGTNPIDNSLENPERLRVAIYKMIQEGKTSIKLSSLQGQFTYKLKLFFSGFYVGEDFTGFTGASNCEINMNFTSQFTRNLKNINLDVAANCSGKRFVPDGFPIYVERENGKFSYQGVLKKGKVTLKGFELNKEYNFKTVYKGKSYFNKWTFTSENFVDKNYAVPDGACDELGF